LPCVPDDSRPLDPTSAVWMRGLVFASDGDVVRAVDPAAGKVFRLAGGGSDPAVVEGPAKLACFRGVSGVAIDEAGLWFGDTKNGAVRRLDFASDRVTTLAERLPEPVELARDGSTVYVGCRQGELFEIDAGTAERRPLEAVRGAIVGLTVVARSLYAATAAGAVLGIDRTNGRVTQRLEIEGSIYCVAQNPHSSLPWLWVGLPGRINKLRVPDGAFEQLARDGVVAQPRALAIVREYIEMFSHFSVTGLYFFDAGNLYRLDRHANNAVTTVLARSG
jgi:hypothetical protein